MNRTIVDAFRLQQSIFGICPECETFFRLSDCRVFLRTRPARTWLDELERTRRRLQERLDEITEQQEELRPNARAAGRRRAQRAIRRIDPIFAPRRLSADDAKIICHPIDFVVFKGMNGRDKAISRIVLLDREPQSRQRDRLQSTIEKTITRGDVRFVLARVDKDGVTTEECELAHVRWTGGVYQLRPASNCSGLT